MLVLNKGFEPKPFFVNFLQEGFGTKLKEYDFSNEKEKSVNEVILINQSTTFINAFRLTVSWHQKQTKESQI